MEVRAEASGWVVVAETFVATFGLDAVNAAVGSVVAAAAVLRNVLRSTPIKAPD